MSDTAKDKVLAALVSALQGAGFVNDEAHEKLSEAVELVFGDPRNDEDEEPKDRTWHLLGDLRRSAWIEVDAPTLAQALEKGKSGDFTIVEEIAAKAEFVLDGVSVDHVKITAGVDIDRRTDSVHEEVIVSGVTMCRLCGPVDRSNNPDPDFHPKIYAAD